MMEVPYLYSLRNGIEYGFKQVKNELRWANFRLTDYPSIKRWGELVMSAYLLVSIQASSFQLETVKVDKNLNGASVNDNNPSRFFGLHPWWELGNNGKSALNN